MPDWLSCAWEVHQAQQELQADRQTLAQTFLEWRRWHRAHRAHAASCIQAEWRRLATAGAFRRARRGARTVQRQWRGARARRLVQRQQQAGDELSRWKCEAAAARLALERCEAQRARESAAAEASEAQLRTELGALRKALTATQRTLDAVHASAAADRDEAEALLRAEQLLRQAEGRKAADSAAQAEAREALSEAKLAKLQRRIDGPPLAPTREARGGQQWLADRAEPASAAGGIGDLQGLLPQGQQQRGPEPPRHPGGSPSPPSNTYTYNYAAHTSAAAAPRRDAPANARAASPLALPPAAALVPPAAPSASPSAVELSRRLSPVVGHSPRAVSPAPFAPLPPPTPPPPPIVSPPPTAAQAGGTPQSAWLAAQQAAQQHAAQQHAAQPQPSSECGDVGDSISRGSGWAPSGAAATPEPPAPPSPAAAAGLGLEVRLQVGELAAVAAPPPPTVLLPSFAPPTAAAAPAAAVPEVGEPEVREPGAHGVRPCGWWTARLCGKGARVSCVALGSDGGSLWVATSTPAAAAPATAAAEGRMVGGDKYAVRAWRLADDTVGASWSRQFEVPNEVGAMQAHGGRAYAACHDGALYRFGEAEPNAPPGTLAHLQAPADTPARFDSGHTAPVLALEVEADARDGMAARPRAALLLTASADATLRGFDLPLRASQLALEPRCVMARHAAAVRALCTVCLPPRFGRPLEARVALSGGDDASVRVWSLRDGVGCRRRRRRRHRHPRPHPCRHPRPHPCRPPRRHHPLPAPAPSSHPRPTPHLSPPSPHPPPGAGAARAWVSCSRSARRCRRCGR